MTLTEIQKDLIRDILDGEGMSVTFSNYRYGIKLEISKKNMSGVLYLSDQRNRAYYILNNLKKNGDIDYIKMTITWNAMNSVQVDLKMKEFTPKKLEDRIDTERFKAKPNKFGQIPEIGDYVVGNKSGNISSLFIAKVVGWDSKALIVKSIMGYDPAGELMAMRWAENMIFPKDLFKEDLDSFLIMMKLSMEI